MTADLTSNTDSLAGQNASPSPGAIRDVIAQLEAATEGSRELDVAIAVASGISAHPGQQSALACGCSAHYTTSLDAALTLVPQGYEWECGFSRYVPHNARVSSSRFSHGGWTGEVDSSRPIALCIAALAARAASIPSTTDRPGGC